MKKVHVKPVGLDGSLRHIVGPDVDERTFNRHVSPKEKNLIEADIADTFARLVADEGGAAACLEQLPENDFDFSWSLGKRAAKIEFTELTLETPPYRNSGQSAVVHYKPWGEKFVDLVNKKNNKSYRDNVPLDLLVYTTHFAYHGNSFCVELAAERLRQFHGGSNFDQIYYLEFRSEASNLYKLKPYLPALPSKIRREYEGHWYSTVNFASGTPVPGGTKFEMVLPDFLRSSDTS